MAAVVFAGTFVAVFAYNRLTTTSPTVVSLLLQWLVLSILTVPFLLLYRLYLYPRLFSPLRHLPTADQGPVSRRLFVRPTSAEQFHDWKRTISNNGLIRYHGLLNKEEVLITSRDAVQEVFKTKAQDYIRPRFARGILASLSGPTSLFIAEGELHKVSRKKTMPFFQPRQMKELYTMFGKVATSLSDTLVGSATGNTGKETTATNGSNGDGENVVELSTMFQRATLDVIGQAGFGHAFMALEQPDSSFVSKYQSAFQIEGWGLRPLLGAFFEFPTVDKILYFSHRNQALLDSMQKDSETNDILDIALRANVFNDDELVDVFTTFLLGGHETSATSLTWIIYHLSQDLSLQSRLREEVRSKFSSPSAAAMSTEEIDSLPLLNGVLKESLRLYPIIRMLQRTVAAKDGTTVAGQFLPCDATITVPVWSINRDKANWGPDADTFNPERWIKDPVHGGATDPWDEMTFSHGTRACVGERFARGELLIMLAVLMGRLEFKFVGTGWTRNTLEKDPAKHKVRTAVVTRIQGGLWVDVKAVPGWGEDT